MGDGGNGATFIDSRLYISVRPYLEYAIPETSGVVRSLLLGDVPRERALTAVARLKASRTCTHDPVTQPEELLQDLGSHCMRVINQAIEHVTHVQEVWWDYLQRTSNGIRTELRSIERDAHDVTAVYKRHRRTNPAIVDLEYKREMARLHARMDAVLETYRHAEQPRVDRPSALQNATHDLREAFANAYGTVDTVELMKMKQFFEWELGYMQTDILEAFCTRCETLLHV